MGLQSSGQISLDDIHVEAGGSSGSEATINDSDIRSLLNPTPASGSELEFADFYGASSAPAHAAIGWAKVVDTTSGSSSYTGAYQNLSIKNGDLLVLTYTCRGGNSGNNVGQFQMFSGTNGSGTQTNIGASTAVKEHGGTVSGIIYATANGSYSSMKAYISASSSFNGMLMMAGVFSGTGNNLPDRTMTGGSGNSTNQSINLSSISPPGVVIAVAGRSTTSSYTVTLSGFDSYLNSNNSDAGGAAGYKLTTGTSFSGSANYPWSISAAHFT